MATAPVIERMARRWFFKHLAISSAIAIVSAEVWWRGYALPRREKRDEYFRSLGVDWARIVD